MVTPSGIEPGTRRLSVCCIEEDVLKRNPAVVGTKDRTETEAAHPGLSADVKGVNFIADHGDVV